MFRAPFIVLTFYPIHRLFVGDNSFASPHIFCNLFIIYGRSYPWEYQPVIISAFNAFITSKNEVNRECSLLHKKYILLPSSFISTFSILAVSVGCQEKI